MKPFRAPFFSHFIQPSPLPIVKLKSLHGVSKGQLPHKNGPIYLWLATHTMTLKFPPTYMLFQVSEIRKLWLYNIQSFPLLLVPTGKPDHQAIHCPTANYGPLYRISVINPMLITAHDAYLIVRSPGAMSLVYKYLTLKEPYI